jgi:hypothetical protein
MSVAPRVAARASRAAAWKTRVNRPDCPVVGEISDGATRIGQERPDDSAAHLCSLSAAIGSSAEASVAITALDAAPPTIDVRSAGACTSAAIHPAVDPVATMGAMRC